MIPNEWVLIEIEIGFFFVHRFLLVSWNIIFPIFFCLFCSFFLSILYRLVFRVCVCVNWFVHLLVNGPPLFTYVRVSVCVYWSALIIWALRRWSYVYFIGLHASLSTKIESCVDCLYSGGVAFMWMCVFRCLAWLI